MTRPFFRPSPPVVYRAPPPAPVPVTLVAATGGSPNRWNKLGVPHKGWDCIDVIDLGEDGAMDEGERATCEMCDNERLRFVHIMKHPDYAHLLRVGCVCSGKMSEDYKRALDDERKLRNKALRKARWLAPKQWKASSDGGAYRTAGYGRAYVYPRGGMWVYVYHHRRSQANYPTEHAAKLAAFEEWDGRRK